MTKTNFEQFSAFNAGCIEEAIMPLNDQGLVCIQGENLDEGDSNGSGKTTLFELIAHTLFGKTTKGPRKNELLCLSNPNDYHTQIIFNQEDKYTIDQYRKHSKQGTCIQIHVNDDPNNRAPDGYELAQKEVTKQLGLRWSEFGGSSYLSQKYTHTMIGGKPSEKQAYLSRYFGLDSIDSMIKESTVRLNAIPLPDEVHLREMLKHVEGEIESLNDMDEVRETLLDTRGEQKKLQDKLLVMKVEEAQQRKSREVYDERKKWMTRLKKLGLSLSPDEIKDSITTYRAELVTLRRGLEDLKLFASLTAKLEALGIETDLSYDEVTDHLSRISEVESRLVNEVLPGIRSRISLEEKLEALPSRASTDDPEDLEAKSSSRKKKKKKVDTNLAVLNQQVTKLNSIGGDFCPTCSRTITDEELAELLRDKTSQIDALLVTQTKLDKSISVLLTRVMNSQDYLEMSSTVSSLPTGDLSSTKEEMIAAKEEKKRLASLSSALVKSSSLQDRLKDLTTPSLSPDEIEKRVEKLPRRIERLEEAHRFSLQYADMEYDPAALQRLTGAILHKEKQLTEAGDSLLQLQDKISKWEAFTKQKEDLEAALSGSSREKNRHQALTYVNFTLKELKKLGLRESTELLTKVLPVYLKQLFPKGEIGLRVTDNSDGFDLLFEKGGQSIPLSAISGGQAKRVGIAIIFAFAKMGRRTTNLLIADEPFTHLDKRGREACYELLRDLNIGTILVTAHDQDLQSSRKYDRIWTVKMKNHRSRLYLD